ncbi:MAG: bifunctional folylpolyglutamate synthase/dihydrofolate synthase [Ekhidna sp.]|nr:bifunctional folylpolyglutamate synthase/dihydrofolate synthase [Ekhidna sp.]
MNYQETLEYLYTRLPMYQREGKRAYTKDLTNTIRLLEELSNPHQNFKSVHIAGTNGKGTSAHAIASILQSAGYKVGLYTSPHLKKFTERIRINGLEIREDFIIEFVDRIKSTIESIHPSFFEITVGMAFDYFAKERVDIAVIETGLGGRLDSTNVITPEVSLITNIGFDHMDLLGDTLPKIASEKAGIIKPGVPVVIGEKQAETAEVFLRKAEKEGAELMFALPSNYRSETLVPDYLVKNLGGVEAVIKVLRDQGWNISDEQLMEGVKRINEQTGLKGRFQVLSETPLTIADVSHNEDGLRTLFAQISELKARNLHLVFGMVQEKELAPIIDLLPKGAKFYWTESHVPRSLPVEELAIQTVVRGKTGDCYKDVNEAIDAATTRAGSDDLVLITGSTFVVAEIDVL